MARAILLLSLLSACDPASMVDAGTARRDAGMDAEVRADAGVDAAVVSDAGSDAGSMMSGDAGVACSVGGVPGACVHVDDCVGENMSTPGFCPGPAEIQCCTPRGAAFDCDPEDMPTPNDGLSEAPGLGGCPSGMTRVGTFCMDRFEASLELVGGGTWSPYHNPEGVAVRAVSIEGAVPQGYITGRQAAAACEAAGKRLCSDEEWLRACRGTAMRTYPYEGARDDDLCNGTRALHPAYERFGTMEDWVFSRLGDACINQLPDSLDPAGANVGCVTDEGVFDLMGNLHEWTADPTGTFRGGYYVDTWRNGEGCLYRTTAHSMGHWDYSTGFRCCAD